MAWNWHLGNIAGIRVQMNVTFLFLLAWVALGGLLSGGLGGSIVSLTLAFLVFGVVVLHELGHAMAARAFGIGTRDITLTPIGGVARLEGIPSKPIQEVIVAAAGPAVNFVLAGIGVALAGVFAQANPVVVSLLSWFVWMNLILALFNLLPAFPMDGGRILRASLSGRFGRVEATAKAARVARWMALLFGLVGLATFRFSLVLIAIFVWGASSLELGMERFRAATGWGAAPIRNPNEVEILDDPTYRPGRTQEYGRVTRVRFL